MNMSLSDSLMALERACVCVCVCVCVCLREENRLSEYLPRPKCFLTNEIVDHSGKRFKLGSKLERKKVRHI